MVLHADKKMLVKDIRVQKEIRALLENGIDVSVITRGDSFNRSRESGYEVIEIDTRCFIPDRFNIYISKKFTILTRISKRIIDSLFYRRIRKFLKDERFDILHCHDYQTLRAAKCKKHNRQYKAIYDSHEIMSEYVYKPNIIGKFNRWSVIMTENIYLKKYIDAVIAVCEYEKDMFNNRYGFNKVSILRNIAENDIDVKNCKDLYEYIHVTNEKRIVMYEGTIVKGKSCDLLLKAAEQFNDNIILVFAGHGNMVEMIIEEEKKRSNIRYLGDLDQDTLVSFIRQSTLGLCLIQNINNSYYYSLPNKLWDFIVNGIPCIASNFPMISQVIDESHAGVTINPDNLHDLISRVNFLCDKKNESIYKELKKNAIEFGKQTNWNTEKRSLINLYKELTD